MNELAERCGDLLEPLSDSRGPEECVLSPGHSGSHAGERGTRWRLATPPLTPRQDAAVRPLETPAGGDAGTEAPEGASGSHADADGCAERVKRWPVIPVADHVAEDQAAWQQCAAARDREADAQVDRWSRREQLGVLLSRMQRGRLLAAERGLLRAAVETELADAEQAWAENARLREERDRARRVAVALEQELARATAQITTN